MILKHMNVAVVEVCGSHTWKKQVMWRRRFFWQKKIGGKFGLKSRKIAKIWPKNGLKWPKIA